MLPTLKMFILLETGLNNPNSPISIFIIIGLIIITLLYLIMRTTGKLLMELKFHKICKRHQLSHHQEAFLKNFIHALRIYNPVKIIKNFEDYSAFADKAANHIANITMGDEDFIKEVENFDKIHRKLGLTKIDIKLNCHSSRSLKDGEKLEMVYENTTTGEKEIFPTTIKKIYDLYFTIEPPPYELRHKLCNNENLTFKVCLEGSSNHYKTTLIRQVLYPNTIWYFKHFQINKHN